MYKHGLRIFDFKFVHEKNNNNVYEFYSYRINNNYVLHSCTCVFNLLKE